MKIALVMTLLFLQTVAKVTAWGLGHRNEKLTEMAETRANLSGIDVS
jgi:hypothetical protein